MLFFLFHWLRPYGDRATIKLLNSWRQGWNWTELPVTWLPLPNDNLGFNQKKPLSAWLIQNSGEERLAQLGTTVYIYIFVCRVYPPLALQSTPLSYKMCFLRMADALTITGKEPSLGVRGFVHSSFSYCLRMSVENAPTTHRTHIHTDRRTDTHTHTFHASSPAIHTIKSQPSR